MLPQGAVGSRVVELGVGQDADDDGRPQPDPDYGYDMPGTTRPGPVPVGVGAAHHYHRQLIISTLCPVSSPICLLLYFRMLLSVLWSSLT